MYKAFTGIIIPVLVVALLGTGYWGYQENQEKNAILIKAENQYQLAFHNLNFHIDRLKDELGKALAVSSHRQISPSLANVWRLAYNAQSEVGQLPLTLIPFNKTEEFLAKISNFSYRIVIRDHQEKPLTEQEYHTLKTLYQHAKEIQKELDRVQTQVIKNNLRWMDVEIALAQEDKQMDNTIIDGFKTIDKKVNEFPEIDWGPTMSSLDEKEKEKGDIIKGKPITAEEAKKRAKAFLGITDHADIEVNKVGKDTDYQAFSVTVKGKENTYLDVTKTGGYVVWMMRNRDVKEKKLSLNQGLIKATNFLKKHGYQSMEPIGVEPFDNSVLFRFAYKEDGVIIYPDLINVKVALDNGEILGFQSVEYVYNHQERNIPSPKLTEEEARKAINPNVKVITIKKALIENFDGEEVLTYEITGKVDDAFYQIYLNAINGYEEMIQNVEQHELAFE